MKTKFKVLIGFLSIILILGFVVGFMFLKMQSQSKNEDPLYWEKDIEKILERYDEIPDVDIVFIGSSSIRKWESLEEDFSGYSVVNHGFGGSKVADSTYWYDELVTPFNPEVVVIFSGTNDINGIEGNSKTGQEVFELVVDFVEYSLQENPSVEVYYISISPTKARWDVWDEAKIANDLIKAYADITDMFTFIDTTDELLLNGEPNSNLFVFDGLHLNDDGYEIWANIIKPIVTETID